MKVFSSKACAPLGARLATIELKKLSRRWLCRGKRERETGLCKCPLAPAASNAQATLVDCPARAAPWTMSQCSAAKCLYLGLPAPFPSEGGSSQARGRLRASREASQWQLEAGPKAAGERLVASASSSFGRWRLSLVPRQTDCLRSPLVAAVQPRRASRWRRRRRRRPASRSCH